MKISEQWLREWVNPDLSTEQLAAQITMAGLEVDGVEPVAPAFSGVVVAEVIEAGQHPDADKLSLCQVSTGSGQVQVVCGAANVRAGLKVAFAEVGAVLPGNFKIKKAKLRGVESFGMICAAEELGLADTTEGEEGAKAGIIELPTDAPVGQCLRDYLGLDDQIIEIDLTPNRGDCLSIQGVAREVGVLNQLTVNCPAMAAVEPVIEDQFPVQLQAPEGCPRYCGRVIRNINIQVESPLWMQEKLRRSGVRSIDPVVDVTNYVMLELGQPMHAFDLDQLAEGIQVRFAKPDERLTLLDGKEIELTEDILVIADARKPLAMAGVMGGEGSGVSGDTQHIFLESAYFDPICIAGKARRYGLHTDSSHRFERGVDYELQVKAIERATELLLGIVGGEPGPVIEVAEEAHVPQQKQIQLNTGFVGEYLGLDLESQEVLNILDRLGLSQVGGDNEEASLNVPSHRFDLSIPVDLVEEIARIYGYNKLPVSLPEAALLPQGEPETQIKTEDYREQLINAGFQEAITYSFVDPAIQSLFDDTDQGIELANPISSDMAVMRTSLLPGLVQAMAFNQRRQQKRVRFFETGLIFKQAGEEISQQPMLAGLLAGSRQPEGWGVDNKAVIDFYDLKQVVESLVGLSAGELRFEPGTHPALHPGQTAVVHLGAGDESRVAGVLGALHPSLLKKLGVSGSVYVFELEIAALEQAGLPSFKELSKFPEVRRDLAIFVDKSKDLSDIIQVVRSSAGDHLLDLVVFDLYEGPGVEEDKKSVAMGLIWQHPEQTLTDAETDQQVNSVIQSLEQELGATLRG